MEIKEILTEALKKKFAGARIELDIALSGKVGGVLLWDGFSGIPQLERQDLVWDYLEKELTKEQQRQIMSVLTLTPEEAGLAA